jgi:hypothetical protein
MMSVTFSKILADARESLIEYLEDPDEDHSDDAVKKFIASTAADETPVMTTSLFQLVVDDNSIAFYEANIESAEPFAVLSNAVMTAIERQLHDAWNVWKSEQEDDDDD